MDRESFPSLNLTSKRLIFWSLMVLFVGYSVMVYTTGTEYTKGLEAYTESAKKGKLVYHEYNCVSCHQIYGLGGYMGPDLTNVMSTSEKGRPYASAFIQAGTLKMPRFDLSEQELNAVLDYLEYVGQAGDYPVTDFELTWYGDVQPKTASNE